MVDYSHYENDHDGYYDNGGGRSGGYDDADADQFGEGSSLGLSKILQDVGVDLKNARLFDQRDQAFGSALAEVEDAEDVRYMDDEDAAEESLEDQQRWARQQAESKRKQAELYRRGREMARQLELQRLAQPESEEDRRMAVMRHVKHVWPDWEVGQRMRMSEVFYETPRMRMERDEEMGRGKRRSTLR